MIKALGKQLVRSNLTLPIGALVKYLEWRDLKQVLSALRINLVLDVGANKGQFVGSLRDIGYGSEIVSFEPLHADYQILETRFKSDPHWRGFNLALGNEDTTKTFNVAVESS